MLATLRFWPLLGLSLTYAATINVIPASDTSLVYSPGWSLEFSQSTQDSFMQAASVGCYLSVTLPINASSVSYLGFKQAGGSMYGYTLDCEEDCLLQTANGSDPTVTDETNVPQSTLFTLDLDPTTQHTLYVYNIPSDTSDGSSQINLNNLNVALADVTTRAGGLPTPSNTVNTGSTSSTTSSADSSSTPEQESSSATPTSPSSSTSATSSSATVTSSSSNGISVTPTNVGASLGSATQTGSTGTEPSGSSTTVSAVLPVITPSSTAESGNGTGAETAGSPSGSKTGGLSKSVTIGVSVLAVVFGGAVIAALFVFIRQRRKKHRNSYPGSFFSGSQPPLSPTGSIIPIMPPPQMRQGSAIYSPAIPNPFIDPPSDLPYNSSLMQRRMEGRTSPGSPASPAPNIPLPDIPRGATDSRSNSPAAAYARSDLWITRSPAKPSFAVL